MYKNNEKITSPMYLLDLKMLLKAIPEVDDRSKSSCLINSGARHSLRIKINKNCSWYINIQKTFNLVSSPIRQK